MGGINTVSGLNKVGLDYRPAIEPNQPNVVDAPRHESEEGDIQEQENNIIYTGENHAGGAVKSMVGKLDTLLLNAAGKAIANSEAKMKDVGSTLVEKGVITAEDAARLESLAKTASERLQALDNYSGREIAGALMSESDDVANSNLVWKKSFWGGMNPVAVAVKAAVEAQEALSAALAEFNESLATNDDVDLALQEAFLDLQFQCDRRATEIFSVAVRMFDIVHREAVEGIVIDPKVNEYLSATFMELMPREAVLMHGTAEALETMKRKFADQMRPLAEKLDAFASDATKTLSDDEVAELSLAMVSMKNAIENVRRNGLAVNIEDTETDKPLAEACANDPKKIVSRTEVDKALLDEMDRILDAAKEQVANAKAESVARSRQSFVREFRYNFDIDRLPNGADLMRQGGDDNEVLAQFKDAANELAGVFEAVGAGDMTMQQFEERFAALKPRFPKSAVLEDAMKEVGFSKDVAGNFVKTVRGLNIIAEQFRELMAVGQRLTDDDSDAMLSAGDVRKIMLGEARLSVFVEAKTRGFAADDVRPETDQSNIARSQKLGAGGAGTTYLLTSKTGEEFVFKPELESRIGLNQLCNGTGKAYRESQKAANLNFATQQTAKIFGCEDIVVKYSVGCHDGQFGFFMEKAKGFPAHKFSTKREGRGEGIAPADLKTEITDPAERVRIQGQIAKKLNKLAWLDLITGQSDRHSDNYFVHIDKHTHQVTVKAIDNDASFNSYRIGLQKYVVESNRKKEFERQLYYSVCVPIHGAQLTTAEYHLRVTRDPGLEVNPDDNTITIDLAKAESPELGMAIGLHAGIMSIALPEEIDKEFSGVLMEMDSDPAKKQAYLDSIAPRISPEALRATAMRLDEAIEHAKSLAAKNRVFDDNHWSNAVQLNQLADTKSSLSIKKSDGKVHPVIPNKENSNLLSTYVTRSTPSLYKRDRFHKMFD